MTKIKARSICIDTINKIISKNIFIKEAINIDIYKVDEIDRNLFRQIVYGVVENLIYLDYIIQKKSKMKLNKMDRKVLIILRIAVYEMRFLESKKYAVINEAVKNTKKVNFRAKNMVNAILRNIDRDKNSFVVENLTKDEYLSIRFSTNMDLVNYIKKNYVEYEKIISNFTGTSNLSIRVNCNLIEKDELISNLESQNYIIEKSEITDSSLIIKNPSGLFETKEFIEGFFLAQDESSILVSEILNPAENSYVLDLCAAPGSKSTHLLQLMKDTGIVYSNDISENKLSKIKDNFDRLKLYNYKLFNYDAMQYITDFDEKFDYILVDAPCSGLGVIKRKPEIKLNRTIEDIKELSNIQKSILENSYKYLKSGGYLVYSTCTIGKIENENIIYEFIEKHNDISIVKIENNDFIQILPDDRRDGFFIAKMKKA